MFSPNHLRILFLLRKSGPLRFNQIQSELSLNPAQVDRALRLLHGGLWVLAETIPSRGTGRRVPMQYLLGKRGAALLSAYDAFLGRLRAQRATIGERAFEDAQSLFA